MGKAQFYDRILFILITSSAFLISGIATTETDEENKEERRYATNEYNLMKVQYTNYPDDGSDFPWKNMEIEKNANNLSDDQFVDGKAVIDLPFEFQLFDLNVTRVAVTKHGIIQSEDPSVNWIIAPLNVESGMTRCNISYLFQGNNLYVQWNNFRFNRKNFDEHDFSFQVRLGDRGEIDFVYKEVPYHLTDLRENCYCLGNSFGVMYPYEEVFDLFKENYDLGLLLDLDEYEVKKGTVVTFFPADECMFRKNCRACTKTKFQINPKKSARCLWCPRIQKCSSRRDGIRHAWKINKCDTYRVKVPNYCNVSLTETPRSLHILIICFSTLLLVTTPIVIMCCFRKQPAEVVLCITSPLEWLRQYIQSTNQPNQVFALNNMQQ